MGNVLKRSSLIKRVNPLTVEELGSLLGFLKKWTSARSVQMSDQYCDLLPKSLIPIWLPYVEYESLIGSWMLGPQPQDSGSDVFSGDGKPYFCFQLLGNGPYSLPNEEVYFICFHEIVKVRTIFDGEFEEEYLMSHERVLEYLAQLPKPLHNFIND
jgi:hypothetical protein